MRIESDIKLDYSDVLIKPKRSTLYSRDSVDLHRSYKFRNSKYEWRGIPIIAANMAGVGTWDMDHSLKKHGMLTCLAKDERNREDVVGGAIPTFGISPAELFAIEKVVPWRKPHFICLDVANGYQESFVREVKRIRECFREITIIAGNVCTSEMTEELILAGADIVKVGIGPGGQCTTRIVTGVGYPQLSAVIECADAAHGLGGHIIADGGIVHVGDIAKAFGAGADFVMLGTMLAGHDEGGEKPIYDPLDPTKMNKVKFYGSSSKSAQPDKAKYAASEGRTTLIPYKGPVENTVLEILGGLRSACTYTGSKSLKELSKRTTFVRVNNTHNRSMEKFTIGD